MPQVINVYTFIILLIILLNHLLLYVLNGLLYVLAEYLNCIIKKFEMKRIDHWIYNDFLELRDEIKRTILAAVKNHQTFYVLELNYFIRWQT